MQEVADIPPSILDNVLVAKSLWGLKKRIFAKIGGRLNGGGEAVDIDRRYLHGVRKVIKRL